MEINNTIFEDNELTNYINNHINDPYEETHFRGYKKISAVHKGVFGEMYVTKYCLSLGMTVDNRSMGSTGHDRIINNIKTEIKFSLSNMVNHVSIGKDWDRLLICIINPIQNIQIIKWIEKDVFIEIKDTYFNHQQGGVGVRNDDYMCTANRLTNLLNSDIMHSMDEW